LGRPSFVNPLVSGNSISMMTMAANKGLKKTAPADRTNGKARNRPSDKRKIAVESCLLVGVV
jgi:hypothetical protein